MAETRLLSRGANAEALAVLARLDQEGTLRKTRICHKQGLVSFGDNDYLGLAHHPAVVQAGADAVLRHGAGAGASRLVGGTTHQVLELEERIAAFKGTKAALVFSSGYHANLGTITALVGRGDVVLCDRLAHASILDAVRLSRAELLRFAHNDTADLKRRLESLGRLRAQGRRALIVTEGLFSMDGDVPPLGEIMDLAERAGALVVIDDAHATGVLGDSGSGSLANCKIAGHPLLDNGNLLVVGTLSKALGSIGGFVCTSAPVRELIVNRARSFIFTTALPPSAIAAAAAALDVIQSPEGARLLSALRLNIGLMRERLTAAGVRHLGDRSSPIVPVVLGDAETALGLSSRLEMQGYYAPAIRPPAVPAGSSRLRITVSARHSEAEVLGITKALAEESTDI